jgi:hypothetical protein
MRCWWCLFSLLYASGCHRGIGELQPSQFDCGNPIIDQSTGAPVRPKHTQGVQQQLPKGVAIEDGCWSVTPDGRLEGYFEKEATAATYVFELRSDRWTLVDTQAWAVARNPYVLHDNVH